jgi:hypothetical protein
MLDGCRPRVSRVPAALQQDSRLDSLEVLLLLIVENEACALNDSCLLVRISAFEYGWLMDIFARFSNMSLGRGFRAKISFGLTWLACALLTHHTCEIQILSANFPQPQERHYQPSSSANPSPHNMAGGISVRDVDVSIYGPSSTAIESATSNTHTQ